MCIRDRRTSAFIAGSENLRFGKFFEQQPGGSHSGFRNEHDGRLYVDVYKRQTVFRNPLAGPSVLGISSGASLGVACVVLDVYKRQALACIRALCIRKTPMPAGLPAEHLPRW